jgi:HD-like signal output (HDOD) protein
MFNATDFTSALDAEIALPSHSAMNPKQQKVIVEVLAALEADQLDLPVLPDMVLKVQALLTDPDSSTGQFVQLISTDLALSLYLIKAANSAALSTGHPVANLHDAIPRLGYRMLYSMVFNLTLSKLFKAKSSIINQKVKELWERSQSVAANSFILAQKQKHLKVEDAMLVGLVHEIGALPLYLYADRFYPEIDLETLETLIHTFAAPVSFKLLHKWNFPDDLVDVVADQFNLRRTAKSELADYVDVITMAHLQAQAKTQKISWTNVRSAERLGYYPGDCENFMANHAAQFSAVSHMMGAG